MDKKIMPDTAEEPVLEDQEIIEPEEKAEPKDEFKEKYLRALADYQNLEKRVARQQEERSKDAQKQLITGLLPILDSMEQAEMFVKDKGLSMVRDQFAQFLKNKGVEEIDIEGQEYDPHTAEAIDIVEGPKDNIVVEVLRKGYMFSGSLVRPAQVKVSRKIETN
jgi:molecular chaperone GrpE